MLNKLVLPSIVAGLGVPGEVGLNVTSRPTTSTAVHWLLEGQATVVRSSLGLAIVTGVGVPGEVGLNVTSSPRVPTAVHCSRAGQETLYNPLPSPP